MVVGKSRSRKDRGRARARRLKSPAAALSSRQRTLRVEVLEDRALLATYTYPYGAQPFDTGEYMLGDVAVNVVLMESNPSLAPYDNNLPSDPLHPGIGAPAENWTTDLIFNVKANISAGLQWWQDALHTAFPNAPANLLNFHINWQYADNPVQTGYEPIARASDDFYIPQGFDVEGQPLPPRGWLYDFLRQVGYSSTRNFSADLRAFNDHTRQVAGTDWAFTIFVVNNNVDTDKFFATGGTFSQAFSFAGGRFEVVPASRPASTYAHETGHQFWALDQYPGGGSYVSQRGYYNTPNLNAADNPAQGFVQAPSIMSNGQALSNAFLNHTSDQYTLAQIGWQDSDHDGLFDVIDVPFSLSGSGAFDVKTGVYKFTGSTVVGTLPNQNTSGSGNDITINQINVIEKSIDGGDWETVKSFDPRTYQANFTLDVSIASPGIHELRLRSKDLRTGVTSNIFIDDVETPVDPPLTISGVVFRDLNANGRRDTGEPSLPDVAITALDLDDEPFNFVRDVEPSLYAQGTLLNSVADSEGVTISAVGPNVANGNVFARDSDILPATPKKNRVFDTDLSGGGPAQAWNAGQQLRVDFSTPVSSVSLRAFGGSTSGVSYGRLEAYSNDGTLLTRFNTGALTTAAATTMTVSRNAGDIAYVIAYGRYGTSVVLDSLSWGPATSATSSNTGAYSLVGLPAGSYHVLVVPPAGYVMTTPPLGYATVTVGSGQSLATVDFGITGYREHPFHNLENPYNVDNDPGNNVSPIDALTIINYLNARPGAEGEIAPDDLPGVFGFIDVNDDGYCAPNDALAVINYINAHPRNTGSGGEGEVPTSARGSESGGEGETTVTVAATADEYYAQHPNLPLNLPGDDEPCTCAQCIGVRTDAALASLALMSSSLPLSASDWNSELATPRKRVSQTATAPAEHPLLTTSPITRDRALHDFLASKSKPEGPANRSTAKTPQDDTSTEAAANAASDELL